MTDDAPKAKPLGEELVEFALFYYAIGVAWLFVWSLPNEPTANTISSLVGIGCIIAMSVYFTQTAIRPAIRCLREKSKEKVSDE